MANFKVFQFPKTLIPNLRDIKYNIFKWNKYDDQCKRRDISFDNFNKILTFSDTCFISPKKQLLTVTPKLVGSKTNFTVHHIIYNISKQYDITNHKDYCNVTVIIYLNKDKGIKDSFWINNNKVNEDFWNPDEGYYKALIFWGNLEHHGIINGCGEREILCFFSD